MHQNPPPTRTISLIGMPGAGKSTVGVLLAKLSGLDFNDTDLEIQVQAGATLQEIIDSRGHIVLRALEEEILLAVPLTHTVIATGGSVVYSDRIMQRLKQAGPVVYLDVPLSTLEARVAAAPPRGIASDVGYSYADVFRERTPLYRRYADFTVATEGRDPQDVAMEILTRLRGAS
ncbi:shikimate kinase [Haliea sp. E1-2-M8]|uniref:shikimate kinase n=1 Tax=Haliea sp. E1-2-M8 TaxID=3064706 RepID=UPI002717A8B8|nr:shikimate kinase [Haliea sp. E1-2-M8]MDO8861035.1 shikimate kinase [Haliea sp. E1-2-M8]